ncbi:MAG: CheR family methyltransferase [Candidatus Thorarchaeota archaeon]
MIKIENIQMDGDYYSLLLEYLNNKTGLNFEYYRQNFIERRLKARMIRVKCDTLHSYYYYIKNNPLEIENFLDSFNINYSCFFRNWEVFQQFENFFLKCLNYKREDVLTNLKPKSKPKSKNLLKNKENSVDRSSYQKLMTKKSQNTLEFFKQTSLHKKINSNSKSKEIIKIWSCPCASGEEPYSIAIILDNLKKQMPEFPQFKIIASDIDKDAINKAHIGLYNENVMQEISKLNEKTYFMKKESRFGYNYLINENIKKFVEFIEEDVTKGHNKTEKYDIIFCRYLLIYISREARKNFLEIIENQLNPGGLLILGKTETLFDSYNTLKLIDSRNHIYLKIN